MSEFKPSKPIRPTGAPDSEFVDSAADTAGSKSAMVTCNWEGQEYGVGSEVCKNKTKFRCSSNGKWVKVGAC